MVQSSENDSCHVSWINYHIKMACNLVHDMTYVAQLKELCLASIIMTNLIIHIMLLKGWGEIQTLLHKIGKLNKIHSHTKFYYSRKLLGVCVNVNTHLLVLFN